MTWVVCISACKVIIRKVLKIPYRILTFESQNPACNPHIYPGILRASLIWEPNLLPPQLGAKLAECGTAFGGLSSRVREIICTMLSQNRETPVYTSKDSNPYYRDPQKGTPNFGSPLYKQRSKLEGKFWQWFPELLLSIN